MRSTSTTVFAVAGPSEVQESEKVARLGKISSELSFRAFRSAGKREAEKGNEMLFRTFTLWCFGRFSNHSKVIEIDNG